MGMSAAAQALWPAYPGRLSLYCEAVVLIRFNKYYTGSLPLYSMMLNKHLQRLGKSQLQVPGGKNMLCSTEWSNKIQQVLWADSFLRIHLSP